MFPPVILVTVRLARSMKSRPLFSILIIGELRAMTAGAAGFVPLFPVSFCARIETLPADTSISSNAKALPAASEVYGACWISALIWRWKSPVGSVPDGDIVAGGAGGGGAPRGRRACGGRGGRRRRELRADLRLGQAGQRDELVDDALIGIEAADDGVLDHLVVPAHHRVEVIDVGDIFEGGRRRTAGQQ